MRISPSMLAWIEAGKPDHGKPSTPGGVCATCGYSSPDDSYTDVKQVDNPTFSNHADFINGVSDCFCPGCTWLYGSGKGKPGNFIAIENGGYHQLVISTASPVVDKQPWIKLIREISSMDRALKVFGVLTTDVKPRVWPRGRLATIGSFGLYVHALDYDLSAYVDIDLRQMKEIIDLCVQGLNEGFSKAALYTSLLKDQKKLDSNPAKYLQLEARFKKARQQAEFIPALIMAQKEI